MKNNRIDPVRETFFGYIETTRDSLLLFEACKQGLLPRISRRLQDSERIVMIKSGSIFCFDEKESGIKRWTDGLVWSPSRIMGNFLVYRELENKKHQQLLCKKTTKRGDQDEGGIIHDEESEEMDYFNYHSLKNSKKSISKVEEKQQHPREKAIVGSLCTSHGSSYQFKRHGLIKKSISLIVDGVQQHIISYYNKEDVLSCRLATPSSILELSSLKVSPGLRLKQNLRIPVLIDHRQAVEEDPIWKRKQQYRKRKYADAIHEFEQQHHDHYPTHYSTEPHHHQQQSNKRLLLAHQRTGHTFIPMTDQHRCAMTPATTTKTIPIVSQQNAVPESYFATLNHMTFPQQPPLFCNVDQPPPSVSHSFESQQHILPAANSSVSSTSSSRSNSVSSSSSSSRSDSSSSGSSNSYNNNQLVNTTDTLRLISSNHSADTTSMMPFSTTSSSPPPPPPPSVTGCISSGGVGGSSYSPIGLLSSAEQDFRQGQNPHQHLFFSNSFHSINHASLLPQHQSNNDHFHFVSANAHMVDVLLGTGWNEFEIQL